MKQADDDLRDLDDHQPIPNADDRLKVAGEMIARHRRLSDDLEQHLALYTEQHDRGDVMAPADRAAYWQGHLEEIEALAGEVRDLRNWSIYDAVENHAESPTAIARRLRFSRAAVLKIVGRVTGKLTVLVTGALIAADHLGILDIDPGTFL